MQNTLDILNALQLAMDNRGLKIPSLSKKLNIPKDRIYKWFQQGTKPKEADSVKIWNWINGENVPHEIKKGAITDTNIDFQKKYIDLLEKENAQKDELIRISLTELVMGQRISQAHLKTLLQITVTETAAMQGKDPLLALDAANKVVADTFSVIQKTGN